MSDVIFQVDGRPFRHVIKVETGQLRPGDKILVEFEVDKTWYGEDYILAQVAGSPAASNHTLYLSDVVAVLPRPIKVGSNVKLSSCDDIYRVLHIEDGFAMVRRPPILSDDLVSGYSVYAVKNLEAVE